MGRRPAALLLPRHLGQQRRWVTGREGGLVCQTPSENLRNSQDQQTRNRLFDEHRSVGFLVRGSKSRSPVHKMIGGSAAVRVKASRWFPYKLDLPKLPAGQAGADWDFAVSFPNPVRPDRCYPPALQHLDEQAGMLPAGNGLEALPALWRVHTADVLVHEIDESGQEVHLRPDQEDLLERLDEAEDGTPPGVSAVEFVLYKEALRTTQAVFALATAAGLPPTLFTWTASMESKAATSQRVSVMVDSEYTARDIVIALRRVGPHKKFPRGRIRVGGVRLADAPLMSGQTRGRRVMALLRNVRATAEEVSAGLSRLGNAGTPNYFGSERFGMTQGPRPVDVAVEVLNHRWRGAVEKILEMEAFMNPGVEAILHHMQATQQVHQGMVDKVPSHLPHIRSMLLGLLRKKSFREAYMSVPPSVRLMWEGVLPSLVWNRLAARRVKMYGQQVRPGDVVWDKERGCARHVESEDDASRQSVFSVVMPVFGTWCADHEETVWPDIHDCDFQTAVEELQALGVTYPPRPPPGWATTKAHYRPLFVRPIRLDWRYFGGELVNARVIATDPHAEQLGCAAGEPVLCSEKTVSADHPLKTKGLAGMMYTFDWRCVECGTHNVFLKTKCGGCEALKDLSVDLGEKERQRGINGDLRNCASVYVSFGLPHGASATTALRSVFELHLWRFYPDGYFYQDVLNPLLRFHLDKPQVAMPPTRLDLQDDSWVLNPKTSDWHDTKWDKMFSVPPEKIDEWYVRHAWRHQSVDNDQRHTSLADAWRTESEAWWNIDLNPTDLSPHTNHKYVHDNVTGGVVRVSKRLRDQRTRTVPPERFTLPVVPLPAAVRNSARESGYFTAR